MVPGTLQQNDVVELINRMLLEMVWSMIGKTHLLNQFWWDALMLPIHLTVFLARPCLKLCKSYGMVKNQV